MSRNQYLCDCDVIHQDVVDKAKAVVPKRSLVDDLATFYKLLGDSTRARICLTLMWEEMCVCDLANVLSMSKSAVSHQLRKLREHGIVSWKQVGKEVYYKLNDEHVEKVLALGFKHISHQQDHQPNEK